MGLSGQRPGCRPVGPLTLVTGATGHLGANLVRALLARGERPRILLQPGGDSSAVDGLDVERVHGDLRDLRSLIEGSAGCERIYHLAARVSLRRMDRQTLFEVNVLGTRNVLSAASANGVRRVVHCSSFGAVGRNPAGASTEDWPLNPVDATDYELSKALAEQEVLRAVLRGLDVTVINPSGFLGAWDFKPNPLGKMILDAARGKLRICPPGGYDFVPVRDVVTGLELAMERGRAGERYLITGEVVSLAEIVTWIAELTGARWRPMTIPPRLTRVLLPLVSVKDRVAARFFPAVHPRLTAPALRLLTTAKHGDSSKARRELGWRPTPLRDAVAEAVAWFASRGWITPAGLRRGRTGKAEAGRWVAPRVPSADSR
jgi:nucleoside-diphosphate-sugar epimerase